MKLPKFVVISEFLSSPQWLTLTLHFNSFFKSFLNFQIVLSLLVELNSAFLLFIFQRGLGKNLSSAESSNALKTGF
ncbi:hypothetical protein T01_3529 [Trichinella spiralis]|uniref:Uncharacterized protein n=1 Tax=Trichinella spiralis TaxID=6334 RepID=A0A0V1AUI8_TRISP|nr:hypothetical protein T01_3529 [Trichinella spiralis]